MKQTVFVSCFFSFVLSRPLCTRLPVPGGQRRQAQSVEGVVRIHDCVLTIPFFGFYGCLRLCPLEEVSEVDSTANTAVREELLGELSYFVEAL